MSKHLCTQCQRRTIGPISWNTYGVRVCDRCEERGESANAMAIRIMNDPSSSYWLKHAIQSANGRANVVEMLNDAETLLDFARKLAADPIHTLK